MDRVAVPDGDEIVNIEDCDTVLDDTTDDDIEVGTGWDIVPVLRVEITEVPTIVDEIGVESLPDGSDNVACEWMRR